MAVREVDQVCVRGFTQVRGTLWEAFNIFSGGLPHTNGAASHQKLT